MAGRKMFSSAYRRYVLASMTAVYMLNLIDRGVIIMLLEPIKNDLHLSDTQLGFLTGIAFGIFYATAGVPIARLADRGNRVTITSLAIGLWGVTVMGTVLVTNFVQLAFARVAAAIGEAGCKPPTYSLIGDYFPEESERTRAMAVYLTGDYLAVAVAFIGAGWLNEHYGWRDTFFLMAVPGLLLAPIIKLTVTEPRTARDHAHAHTSRSPSMQSVLNILWHQRSCRHLCLGLIAFYTMGLGLSPWKAAFMIRTYGMGTADLGLWMGLISGLSGIAGLLLGSHFATRWFGNNDKRQMQMSGVAIALIAPCYAAFLFLPGRHEALAALIPLQIAFSLFLAPTYALLQRLVPDEMRATIMAVVMLLANLIGFGIGPQFVGILSDLLVPIAGHDSLRYAMLAMSWVAFLGAYHFWTVGRNVEADLALSAATSRGGPALALAKR